MNVSVVGSGYVGTTVAACFASSGHTVTAIDTDPDIVDTINRGEASIHEPGVDALIAETSGTRLRASTSYDAIPDTDVTIVALPTPSRDDGRIDTRVIEAGMQSLGEALQGSEPGHCVVVKSTVIPGTTDDVLIPILESASALEADREVDVAVNPEFLREGSAVRDFQSPDKVVIGASTQRCVETVRSVYTPVIDSAIPVIETGRREAEFIKYANNAFLAAKVSLINEIGNIAKQYGVDTYAVADALGADHRISDQFLRSGVGWGGSCWPKDVGALITAAHDQDYAPALLEAVVQVNDTQPARMVSLLESHVEIAGERVAVLGLSFKSGTDDVRNSQAIRVIEELHERDAVVVGYDPVANDAMAERIPEIEYADSVRDALTGAVGAVVTTDWDEFADLDDEFDVMASPVVIDGRRVISRRDGIVYEGLTW